MTDIRAFYNPTNQWRWAVMGNDNTYVRLDPHAGEHLHEFSVHEVNITKKEGNTETFEVLHSLNHLPRVLS